MTHKGASVVSIGPPVRPAEIQTLPPGGVEVLLDEARERTLALVEPV